MLKYGKDFLADFTPVRAEDKNGAFITSCICHGCPWTSPTALNIDGKSVHQHYAACAVWDSNFSGPFVLHAVNGRALHEHSPSVSKGR